MHGHFAWNELLTSDVEAAKTFYGHLLGWQFDRMPMPQGGDYWVATVDGMPRAGIMSVAAASPGTPPQWFAYIAVTAVDESCAALVEAGGTVLQPPWDIPDVGRIAVVTDPHGVAFGLMTPVARPR